MIRLIDISNLKFTKIRSAALVFFSLAFVFSGGCDKTWDDHYNNTEASVNQIMWDAIRENEQYSQFVKYIIEYELDSLLLNNQQYTLFIPNNEAFLAAPDTLEINDFILLHLISPNILNLRNIHTSRKLQTLSNKFALIEYIESTHYYDDTEIVYSSPLFLNGRYYELNQLTLAKPNFEEYFYHYIPVMFDYVNYQVYDSLDKNVSTPIGFDEEGNTIYDSVFIEINPFEDRYFPISEESRESFATFVIFSQEQYDLALDEMAQNIGGVYNSHEDIPIEWQESVLLPAVLDNGVFEEALSIEQLADPNLLNINGERVYLDYTTIDPDSKINCSNGLIYNFYEFAVADSLYLGDIKMEGESLVDSIGLGKYSWKEFVTVSGEIVEPTISKSDQASGGSILVASLGRNFSGTYSVEFSFHNIFPGKHRLEWAANYRPSGIYNVYVNDFLLGEFDMFNLRYSLQSVTGEIFAPNSAGFNRVDFWVENLTEYGEVRIKFEFIDRGVSSDNGFNIDYVSLIPAAE